MGIKSECSSKVSTEEQRESQGGHPGLPIPKSPYGLCGPKATLNVNRFCSTSLHLHSSVFKWTKATLNVNRFCSTSLHLHSSVFKWTKATLNVNRFCSTSLHLHSSVFKWTKVLRFDCVPLTLFGKTVVCMPAGQLGFICNRCCMLIALD